MCNYNNIKQKQMKKILLMLFPVNSTLIEGASEKALGSFYKVVDELKMLNKLSQVKKDKLVSKQDEIEIEIKRFDSITLANTKVINNIERFLKQ
jgi:hypothetical protein